jgi:leucyl aminopeptidase
MADFEMTAAVFGLGDVAEGATAGTAAGAPDAVKTLIIVHVDDWETWHSTADHLARNWITAQKFSGNPGTALAIPTADGEIERAVGVVGKHGVWDGAGLAKSLPLATWAIDRASGSALSDEACEMLALGWALSQYRFERYKNTPPTGEAPNCLQIPAGSNRERLLGLVQGVWLCRNLINIPANHMTPKGLEDAARNLATQFSAGMTVISGPELETACPALHTVGRAAEVGPRMIDMSWGRTGPKITLVGKGITFDTGGLDLKPSKAMEMMKKDMGGAATVLGLAAAIMAAQLPVQLRVLVAAAENAVSERAMRPLDVINTRAGIKVEVGNTDAEGRLVLADALTMALEGALEGAREKTREEEADFVIDFATLTGAARVALGTELPALFCNQDDTADQIIDASNAAGDPLWRLPLFDDYDRHLDNGHVTLSSTGGSGYGGAITAALFLRRFAGQTSNWAHIDVMAWNLGSRPGRPKGGEAMGLRAIFRYIETLANR